MLSNIPYQISALTVHLNLSHLISPTVYESTMLIKVGSLAKIQYRCIHGTHIRT